MRRTLGTGSFSSYAILGNFIGGFKEGFTALDMVEKGCVSFLLTLVNIMYGQPFPLPQVYSTIIIVGYGVFKLKEVAVIDSSDATKKWSEEVARIRKTIRTQSSHVWILCEPSILSRMIIPEHVTLVLFSFSLQRSRYRQLQDDREGCTGMLSLCLCHIPRSLQPTRLSIQRHCTNEYPFFSLSLILKLSFMSVQLYYWEWVDPVVVDQLSKESCSYQWDFLFHEIMFLMWFLVDGKQNNTQMRLIIKTVRSSRCIQVITLQLICL